ncbi:GWxTD domain-containing protein [Jiulongibacter sediminis]|jgi:GWxTD domain-containing protein|uniref:GWxTD domain-containing protein n=1 Tax=Jiulongibacter sediminis TaxID=1605367 RepID=UPI0026F13451|nr:GWxTD domain-containing protein [Jiulongibacter sediminis]
MKYKGLLSFFFAFAVLSACKVQNKTSVNSESLTSRKEMKKELNPFISAMKVEYILKDSTEIVVFLDATIENLESNEINSIEELADRFRVTWALQAPTGIKEKYESGRVNFEEVEASLLDQKLNMVFEIPRLREFQEASLSMEFIDISASRKFTNESYVDFNAQRPNRRFGMYLENQDIPFFDAYVNVGNKVTFKSMDGFEHPLVLKRYRTEAPAALSPMSSSKRNELAGFREEETIKFKSGEELRLDKEGTYVLYDQEKFDAGYGFMVVDERYPRLSEEEELTEPLVYMSTNDEINNLKGAEDFKKALDLYFLNMTSGNQALAKQIIRSYYRRVKRANELFTTYKEGWKTDKGMIYTVLGPPSRIQRNGMREVWLYSQSANFSEIIFTFYRKPNQFSEDHYELVRYPEYGAYWYPFVEAWRTGSIME